MKPFCHHRTLTTLLVSALVVFTGLSSAARAAENEPKPEAVPAAETETIVMEADPVPLPASSRAAEPALISAEAAGAPAAAGPAAAAQVPAPARAGKGFYLSLADCIEIAVQNNLGLRISRLRDISTELNVRKAWAAYYPEFRTGVLHSGQNALDRSGSKDTDSNAFSAGVTQRSPWGTTLDFAMSEQRTHFNRSDASGNWSASLTQPLWKGAGTDVGLSEIRQARIQRLVSRGALELDTQGVIFQIKQAYAEIIRQTQALEVAQQSVRSARTFLELTGAREKAGQVTKLDVFNADVQLRRRELDVVTGERQLESDKDLLKQLMDVSLDEEIDTGVPHVDFGEKPEAGLVKELRSDEQSGSVTLATVKDGKLIGPPVLLFQATRFDDAVIMREAMTNRVDLLNSRRTVAIQKLQTLLAQDGLGHQVDLVGSFGRTDAGRMLFESDNGREVNNWSVGVNAVIPWGKIRDRASCEQALLALRQSEVQLKSVHTTVQLEVRNTLRVLREYGKAMLIQAQRVEQAKRSVDAAQSRFERGLNDSFEVIRAEDDLLAAKNDFISQQQQYVVALARLEVVVGKPTGRIDLEGQTPGGLIDSRLPGDLVKRGLPGAQPEPEPSPETDPLNSSRRYRQDYKPGRHDPVVLPADR